MVMLLIENRRGNLVTTTTSYLYLFSTVVTILGLGLLLLAQPLHTEVRLAFKELMTDCNVGPRTQNLTAYYHVLLNTRLQPGCLNKTSVEQCSGFKDQHPYTALLKQMEVEYLCSGFCYQAASQNSSATKTAPGAAALGQIEDTVSDFVGLLQHNGLTVMQNNLAGDSISIVQISRDTFKHRGAGHGQSGPASHQKPIDMKGLFLLAGSRNMSKSPAISDNTSEPVAIWETSPKGLGNTINNMASTGWMDSYPPTLFTNANYKSTCEGAAARELQFSAGDAANLMYLEGAALLLFSVMVGFVRSCTLCKTREWGEPNGRYGPDGSATKASVL